MIRTVKCHIRYVLFYFIYVCITNSMFATILVASRAYNVSIAVVAYILAYSLTDSL